MVHVTAAVGTARERRHDGNLARILDAAMKVVAEGGLEALSIQRLAREVDYTPGALYRYFDSKDAILSALVERTLGEVRERLVAADAALGAKAPPLARVVAIAAAYAAFAREEPHRFGLLATTLADPRVLLDRPADATPVVRIMTAALEPVAAALAAAAARGALAEGDVAERALCLFAMLHGLLQMRKQERHAPAVLDVDRLAGAGTRALLAGWGAKPRALDAAFPTRPTGDRS